jgi:hypothetical protein
MEPLDPERFPRLNSHPTKEKIKEMSPEILKAEYNDIVKLYEMFIHIKQTEEENKKLHIDNNELRMKLDEKNLHIEKQNSIINGFLNKKVVIKTKIKIIQNHFRSYESHSKSFKIIFARMKVIQNKKKIPHKMSDILELPEI